MSEPGADRGPRAGNPRGVVDATGSSTNLLVDRVATAPRSETAYRPDERKSFADPPKANGYKQGHHQPKFPEACKSIFPSCLDVMRHVHVQIRRRRQTRNNLHEEIPDERIEPRQSIHSNSRQND